MKVKLENHLKLCSDTVLKIFLKSVILLKSFSSISKNRFLAMAQYFNSAKFFNKTDRIQKSFVKLLNFSQNCTQKFIYKDSTLDSWSQFSFPKIPKKRYNLKNYRNLPHHPAVIQQTLRVLHLLTN